ncbi:restriction endonuclease subunit S [Psychrobacter sp. Ps1]|uniref:restriction endonuclease subunit S n=1 Tax=Psychrobacter sp. Ps1 TaxID=2790955 RepID=UPI001EDF1E05|nr:restriction endonuclease subunit S [Psychrobacter sp. Ps1]MCG3842403.1 restriction endonuclease subunit S [Psychrobacter sp. Ps1]
MGSDWKEVSLGEIGRVVTGKTPKTKVIENFGHEIPFITPRDMDDQRIISETERYLSKVGSVSVKNSIIPANSISVSCIGSDMGKSAITKYLSVTNQQINSIVVSDEFYYKFVYYNLSSRKAEIRGLAGGSAQPILNKSDFSQIKMFVPPLTEQKAIAYILGSLDDKIELNRQMNETLEAMAQALFKSWFVDFDPVIDNALAAGNAIPDEFFERAELRKGIEKKDNSDIQSLFPDEFEFTEEMGWIPKGWQELQIKDIAKVVKGKSYKSSELSESETALVTLKSFKRGGGYRLDGLKEYTGKYKEEQEVKAGDLVIAYTDVTQAADLIGKPAMVIDDIRYKHLVISLDVAVVRPEIDSQKYYLYGLAQTEAFQSHNYSHSTGTTVLHLSKNAVPDYYLCLPSENLLHGFTKIVEPLFTSVNNNIGEIRNLEKLRDTLLPKLMSGELRIPDAEVLVENV